jgi:hypothetical protein
VNSALAASRVGVIRLGALSSFRGRLSKPWRGQPEDALRFQRLCGFAHVSNFRRGATF